MPMAVQPVLVSAATQPPTTAAPAAGGRFNLLGNRLRVQLPVEYYGDRFADAANSVKLPILIEQTSSTTQLKLKNTRSPISMFVP